MMSPINRWMVEFRYRRLGHSTLWNPDAFEACECPDPEAAPRPSLSHESATGDDDFVAIRMLLEVEPQVGKELHTCLGAARRQADAQFQSQRPDATLGYWW